MPDKNAVDDLVKRYFQSYDPAVREYTLQTLYFVLGS
jgi:hypothetical protein